MVCKVSLVTNTGTYLLDTVAHLEMNRPLFLDIRSIKISTGKTREHKNN